MVGKLFDHHAPLRAIALVAAVLTFATPGSASTVQRGQGGIFSLGEKLIERAFVVPDGGSLHIEFPEITFINAEGIGISFFGVHDGEHFREIEAAWNHAKAAAGRNPEHRKGVFGRIR